MLKPAVQPSSIFQNCSVTGTETSQPRTILSNQSGSSGLHLSHAQADFRTLRLHQGGSLCQCHGCSVSPRGWCTKSQSANFTVEFFLHAKHCAHHQFRVASFWLKLIEPVFLNSTFCIIQNHSARHPDIHRMIAQVSNPVRYPEILNHHDLGLGAGLYGLSSVMSHLGHATEGHFITHRVSRLHEELCIYIYILT